MFRKKYWIFLILVYLAFFSSCMTNYMNPKGPIYSGSYVKIHPTFSDSIKVVSYNIKFGKEIEQAIGEFSQRSELQQADIILLQEMNPEGVELIAQRLNYNYVYYPATVRVEHKKDFGNAILSRWAIENPKKLILPHKHPLNQQIRIATVATIVVGEFEILTFSVHTETAWLEYERKLDQVESILKYIEDDFEYVIVGGDFNTDTQDSIQATEKLFEEEGFTRASKGIGETKKGDPLGWIIFELDHVFVKGLRVVEKGKVEDVEASDHFPVWLVLKFDGK